MSDKISLEKWRALVESGDITYLKNAKFAAKDSVFKQLFEPESTDLDITVKKKRRKKGERATEAKNLTIIKGWVQTMVGKCNMGEEFKFDEVRKFRFDVVIPAYKVAIEYEGINSKKSRHTTPKGYTMDTTKYNLAHDNGWIVLRYTYMNYQDVMIDLWKVFKNHPEVVLEKCS